VKKGLQKNTVVLYHYFQSGLKENIFTSIYNLYKQEKMMLSTSSEGFVFI